MKTSTDKILSIENHQVPSKIITAKITNGYAVMPDLALT